MTSYIICIKNKKHNKEIEIDLSIQELPSSVLCPEAKLLHIYLASRDNDLYKRLDAIRILGSSYKVDKAISQLKKIGLLEIKLIKKNGRFKGSNFIVNLNLNNKLEASK